MKAKLLWVLLLLTGRAFAAEVTPPKPAAYFNDDAHVVTAGTANELNQQLEQFERKTSIQVVVAVFPRMQSDSSIEDYTVRVAQTWGVGQKGKNNGAVLFVFTQDRKMYLQVGYGLEGALPDALAKRIIEDEIKPHFRNNDYAGGLRAGIAAILQATQGEYKGTGHTAAEKPTFLFWVIAGIFILVAVVYITKKAQYPHGGTTYTRSGRRTTDWGSSGGWFSSGGGGGGGGGFSGGGGSFGGGGAGGSW